MGESVLLLHATVNVELSGTRQGFGIEAVELIGGRQKSCGCCNLSFGWWESTSREWKVPESTGQDLPCPKVPLQTSACLFTSSLLAFSSRFESP